MMDFLPNRRRGIEVSFAVGLRVIQDGVMVDTGKWRRDNVGSLAGCTAVG